MPLQILAHQLHRILSEAAMFAHPYDDIPAINAVVLEFDGTNLIAVASDRFYLGISRLRIDSGDEVAPFETAMRLADVNTLIKHAKTVRKEQEIRTVDLDIVDTQINISENQQPSMFSFKVYEGIEIAARVSPMAARFPDWKPLMHQPADVTPTGRMAFDPHKLAPFLKIAGDREVRFIFRGEQKTVVVQIGDNEEFVGLVMPRRKDDRDSWAQPSWLPKVEEKGDVFGRH